MSYSVLRRSNWVYFNIVLYVKIALKQTVLRGWRYYNSCSVLHGCGLQKCHFFRYILYGRPRQLSRYSNSLLPGRSGNRNRARGDFFRTSSGRPWASLSSPYNTYWVIFRGKAAGACLYQPPSSTTEIKKENYTFSPFLYLHGTLYFIYTSISKCVFICIRRRTVKTWMDDLRSW
jgi:hypothetical protein